MIRGMKDEKGYERFTLNKLVSRCELRVVSIQSQVKHKLFFWLSHSEDVNYLHVAQSSLEHLWLNRHTCLFS